MPEDLAIELRGVKKSFDGTVAVQHFDVGIRKGEFFSLLGPSGCGKTTTLRMIAGLEEPTEGEILLEGRDVSRVPAYRRNVHTVFQDYALFPHMTLEKNIWFPLRMRGISLADARERIARVLRIVNMEGFERRLPQQLSGGQRQRIALARSLVDEPAALLLDEPLGALDFKLRVAMQKVLKDIQRKVGITFIYVTHDQTEALTMSDRIAVMKGGHVHQIGTPDEIYNNPATAFVASFIGDMNFLHGKLVSAGTPAGEAGAWGAASCTVDVDGTVMSAARLACAPDGSCPKPGEAVLVCVRTERVQINPRRCTENTLQGAVRRVVFRGTDYEATCELAGQEVRAVVSAVGWDPGIAIGGCAEIGFNAADISVFPRSEESEIIQYSTESV
jgi:ABC-type Fe3+/spermidine/putrescine transport system ATPase subunit